MVQLRLYLKRAKGENKVKRLSRMLALFVAVLALVVTQVAPMTVKAAETSSGLSIAPKKNYTIEAGRTITDKLQINNLNRSQPLVLNMRVVDFTFMDETGTPKLNLDQGATPTTWSLRPFIKMSKESVAVAAGKSASVDYSITIPKNQGAGSYYSAIVYSSGGADGGQVNLNASGVTLAFASVPGTVKENLTLTKLGTYQRHEQVAGGAFTFINTDKPKEIGFMLKNAGNVAESPTGSIILHRSFSNQNIQIDNVNPNGSLALLGQTRLFTTCINLEEKEASLAGSSTTVKQCASPSLWPGRYTVQLNLVYGQNGNLTQEIAGSASFWYLPWWFIGAVVGGIALIAYAVWRIKQKIDAAVQGKKYRRHGGRRR